jgi:predicted negative regulator of RcsB-dependent stress response
MDGTLKFLIGAACVVVIAAGGWFAWSKYEARSNKQAVEQARTYLFNRAKSGPNDQDKVNAYCKATLKHVADGGTDNPFINDDARACRAFGFGQ